MFPAREEAAYSNFRLWESLGFIIAYVYSPYLYAYVKLYILLAVLLVGVSGYLVVEYRMREALKMKEISENNSSVASEENFARTNKAFEKED